MKLLKVKLSLNLINHQNANFYDGYKSIKAWTIDYVPDKDDAKTIVMTQNPNNIRDWPADIMFMMHVLNKQRK